VTRQLAEATDFYAISYHHETMSALPAGKLPNHILEQLLSRIRLTDPRVVVGPGVGRDAAVIDTGGERLLVAKSDPVTFAADAIGWYAVHVNANDIACMGGRPAWFLATVLLPEECAEGLPGEIFSQISDACDSLGVALVGGHTEVTHGLDRPIIAGSMLGEVERERLVRPETARVGDALILARGIAIEGTSVLAREKREALAELGVPNDALDRAAAYLHDPGISVVSAARAICDAVPVRALHDPTEGGLATALNEVAAACSLGIEVDGAAIDVLPETLAICEAAGLDPLGMLASGALLAVVPDGDSDAAIAALNAAAAPARRIGSMVASKDGVIMAVNSGRRAVPTFARDEVARFLSGRPG